MKKAPTSEHEIELSAISDVSEDFLSEKELNYYLNLKDLFETLPHLRHE